MTIGLVVPTREELERLELLMLQGKFQTVYDRLLWIVHPWSSERIVTYSASHVDECKLVIEAIALFFEATLEIAQSSLRRSAVVLFHKKAQELLTRYHIPLILQLDDSRALRSGIVNLKRQKLMFEFYLADAQTGKIPEAWYKSFDDLHLRGAGGGFMLHFVQFAYCLLIDSDKVPNLFSGLIDAAVEEGRCVSLMALTAAYVSWLKRQEKKQMRTPLMDWYESRALSAIRKHAPAAFDVTVERICRRYYWQMLYYRFRVRSIIRNTFPLSTA